jgi:O-antigen ligase
MVLILCSLLAIFFLVFFVLQSNENVGYFSLVGAFVIPGIFLKFILTEGPTSVSSGGSPRYNLLLIFSQGIFLAVALFTFGIESKANTAKRSLNTAAAYSTLFFGFVLLLMQFISAFNSSPRVIPLIHTFLFSSSIIALRNMRFEKLQIAIAKVFLIIAIIVLLGILLRFKWGTGDEYVAFYEQGIYFSPFNSLLGLPSRIAGPFGSAQDLGIFCSMGFALTIFCNLKSSATKLSSSLVFIFLGTLTGSRTFYIAVFTSIVLAALYSFSKKYNLNFLILAILGFFVVYFFVTKFFLSNFSNSSNVSEIGGRTLLWQTIFRHWADNGLLGFGPNTLESYMHSQLGVLVYGHAHNSILQYLWDFGAPGVFAIISFIISWIMTMNSRKLYGRNALCIFLVFLTIQTEITFQIGLGFKELVVLLFVLAIIDDRTPKISRQESEKTDDNTLVPHEK